jgi:G3E family GTPase
MSGDRIAVTIIGGYLGAGKTTLLNHLLATTDERVAILVNDFGELNIDVSLIEAAEGNTISLPNGCICCSMIDGLGAAMSDIDELDPRPQRLVIEASGVADPAGVAAFTHRRGYRLDLVVVMVDGEQFATNAADQYVGETVRGQLAAADLVIVNKTDLMDDAADSRLDELLHRLAPAVPTVRAVNAVIDPAVLLDLSPRDVAPQADRLHDHGVPFETWSYEGGVVDLRTVRAMAHALPPAVVRAKGIVATPEGTQVFQRVGSRWTLTEQVTLGSVPSVTSLVAIGLPGAITDDWLRDQLENSH